MKKIIALAILVIAIVFIGAPYVTGKVAETQVANIIEQSNQSSLSYGSSEILSYQRGAFNSTSLYRHTFPIAFQTLTDLESVDYQCDLDHGIIGIDYICSITDNPSYSKLITTYFGGKSPLSMTGDINVFGNIAHTIAIDEINNLQLDNSPASVTLAKSTLTINTGKELKNYVISGSSEHLSLDYEGQKMSFNNLSLGGDLSKFNSSIFLGDFNIDIDQIEVNSTESVMSIDDLKVVTNAQENGENLDSKMVFSLEKMSLTNAPIKSIDKLNFETSLGGLNIQAFTEYQALAMEMQNQMFSSDSSKTPTTDPMQMVPILERMLQKDFNFGFDVSGELNGKPNSLKFDIKLQEALTMGSLMSLAIAPESALGKFNLGIDAVLDEKTVVNKINQSPYFNPSLLKKSGNKYHFSLSLNDELTFNGQPMTMQELQALFMSGPVQ